MNGENSVLSLVNRDSTIFFFVIIYDRMYPQMYHMQE